MLRFTAMLTALAITVSMLTSCGSSSQSKSDSENAQSSELRLGGVRNAEAPKEIYYESEKDYLYYSDDYFKKPSTNYNEHLSSLSIMMANYSMNPGNPKSLDDTDWYKNQSSRVREFYDLIGFKEAEVNKDYESRTAFDTIGIIAANRKVDDYTVIACTVRSGGYFLEWENNVFLGDGTKSDYMHGGWYNAANKVIDFLGSYIKEKGITGKIKLWVSGFSRGGATMNLTAGLVDNKIAKGSDSVFPNVTLEHNDLYAYSFEAPQGANVNSKTVAAPTDAIYNNIFNIINPNDLVTKVAMADYGFRRFGIDKYITTQFFDPDNFASNRESVKEIYKAKYPNYKWISDDFTMYTINTADLISLTNMGVLVRDIVNVVDSIEEGKLPDIIHVNDKKVHYDANTAVTLLIDRAMGKIENRSDYCNKIQPFARELMKVLFTDVKDPNTPSIGEIGIKLVFQAIAYGVFGDSSFISDFSKITGATDEEIKSMLEILWYTFEEYPNEMISVGICIKNVFENHSTSINMAHIQAQDSYYVDHYRKNNDKVHLVPLRNNADFFRIELVDLNKAWLKNTDKDQVVIDIAGHDTGASDINTCKDGYIAGYYNYATYERLELFMPGRYNYYIDAYEHSLDLSHHVKGVIWHYFSNGEMYRKSKVFVDEDVTMDGGPYKTNIEKVVNE